MANYEIIESNYIPLTTVRKVLRKRNKSEMTYEQKMALENAEEFTRVSEASANKLIKGLDNTEMRKLKPEFITKIVDITPKTKEELKLILSASKLSFKDEELQQILDIVKENAK
ncbi:MAG: hypothetical protein WC307_05850 [Candidatus Nanoarchaeia archaeon]|jgi:DNA-directed RNA polymerase subunit F